MQLSIMLHAREAFAAAAAAAAGGAAPSAVRQHVLADSQLVTGNWQLPRQSPLPAHVYTLPPCGSVGTAGRVCCGPTWRMNSSFVMCIASHYHNCCHANHATRRVAAK